MPHEQPPPPPRRPRTEQETRSLLQPRPRARTQTELRRTPRFRVAASVLIDHAGNVAKLPLVNVSATGALISTGAREPKVRVGALLFITLMVDGDPTRKVDVSARVIRKSENEAAVDWSDHPATIDAVAELLRATAAG